MSEKTIWNPRGYFNQKFAREGTTENGNTFYSATLSVWKGKKKIDGEEKNVYDNVAVTFWNGQIDTLNDILANAEDPSSVQLTLRGYPFADSYINKEGELVQKLGIKLAKEDYVEEFIWEEGGGNYKGFAGEEPGAEDDYAPVTSSRSTDTSGKGFDVDDLADWSEESDAPF